MNALARWMLCSLIATGCAAANDQQLANAAAEYRATGSFGTLEVIARHLKKGMPRKEVEKLLGEEPLCPVSSHCYYDSDKRELMKKDAAVNVDVMGTWVLGVSYNDSEGNETDRLQSWGFSLIGE